MSGPGTRAARRARLRQGGAALRVLLLAAVLVFLMLPIVVIVLVSFTRGVVFALPSDGLSLRWYARLWELDSFWDSLVTSTVVATAATAASLALGIPGAIALSRARFRGRDAIATFVASPLMLPGLVIGIALLQSLRAAGVRDAMSGLLIAHVVITLPFVVRAVVASLALFDFTLIDAARTLGCSYPKATLRVLVPAIAPGVLAGAMFAFIASFDNYAVSLFLTDVHVKTLPIQMLNYLEQAPDPSLAAISTVMIVVTVVMLAVCERLVGLGRLARG